MKNEKEYKCKMEFFRWKKKSNPLSWIRVTSPTGNPILINTSFNRSTSLPKEDIKFLEALAVGDDWPKSNTKTYSKNTLHKFLEISKK